MDNPPAIHAALSAGDGTALFTRRWETAGESRGQLLIVHGLKDHSRRYERLARAATTAGLGVQAFDLRGHGASAGERAHVDRFDRYLDDLDRVVRATRATHPTGPLFLFGHSMGGAIALAYLLSGTTRFDGLLLSGPAILPPPTTTAGERAVVGLLSALAPRARIFDLPDRAFSRDPAEVAALMADPLVFHGKATARLARELLARMRATRALLEKVQVPFLVLHGSRDTLTNPAGSEELHRRAASRDKRFTLVDGAAHDLLHDSDPQAVLNAIVEWLAIRLPDA